MADEPEEEQKAAKPSGPAAKPKWVPRSRDYVGENKLLRVQRGTTRYHPLASKEALKEQAAATAAEEENAENEEAAAADEGGTARADEDDPLSMLGGAGAHQVDDDPLRMMLGQARAEEKVAAPTSDRKARPRPPPGPPPLSGTSGRPQETESDVTDVQRQLDWLSNTQKKAGYEPWTEKSKQILAKYTTNKRVAVRATFLEEDAKKAEAGESSSPTAADQQKSERAIAQEKAVDEQSKNRLEQLTMDENSQEAKSMMSQKEYVAHIEEQHQRLKDAWDAGERVLSLKIAIQCAKLLGDTSVPQFYPSMYVLLTAILDTFGDLVFQRIRRKGLVTAQGVCKSLPPDFKCSDASQQAKETCRNWFYKTACIRELMPRFYVDLALIKSYRFLEEAEEYPKTFSRLSRMIRGIGDPLAAMYARAFLAKKVSDVHSTFMTNQVVDPLPKGYLKPCLEAFDDFMYTFRVMKETEWKAVATVRANKISLDKYIELFSPAIQWLLQNIGFKSNEQIFFAILQQYREYCGNSAVLLYIITTFDKSYVSAHALDMCTLIKEAAANTEIKKSSLYLELGHLLVTIAPPKDQQLPILNDIWKAVTKITDPLEYTTIAKVFVQYLLLNFTDREVNIFLKDVIKHVKKDQAYLELQEQLSGVLAQVALLSKDIKKTLSMDNFLPVLDLLEKKHKVACAKAILEKWAAVKGTTSDPVIIHTLFDVARSLHDSLDSLSFEDDRKQISELLVIFIRKIDFGRDLEQQLNIYVDCRQAFTALDSVTRELVLRVMRLASKAYQFMKGKHTKKTAAFIKACLAYCHITIPSLDDIFLRLELFLQCGQVALVNSMIVQGEALLKAAIGLIPEVPATMEIRGKVVATEDELVSYLRNFSSFILLFPGHPKFGPFYLVKGLLNAIQAYEPWKAASQGKVRVYLGVLQLFCTYYQRDFPYHVERVESNDALYAGDESYMDQLYKYVDTLVQGILKQLTEIGEKGDIVSRKIQGTLAMEFVNVIISSMEMNPQSATLIVKLYLLAQKSNAADQKFMESTLAHLDALKGTWYADVAAKIRSTPG